MTRFNQTLCAEYTTEGYIIFVLSIRQLVPWCRIFLEKNIAISYFRTMNYTNVTGGISKTSVT